MAWNKETDIQGSTFILIVFTFTSTVVSFPQICLVVYKVELLTVCSSQLKHNLRQETTVRFGQ
jgi:hypothetical protein